jgi:hypothetical protein
MIGPPPEGKDEAKHAHGQWYGQVLRLDSWWLTAFSQVISRSWIAASLIGRRSCLNSKKTRGASRSGASAVKKGRDKDRGDFHGAGLELARWMEDYACGLAPWVAFCFQLLPLAGPWLA